MEGKLVKAKPIESKLLRKLPEFHKPKDFVTSSTKNRPEFEVERSRKSNEEKLLSSRLTDEERNQIAAKIMKAEMLGNQELVEQLKKKLRDSETDDNDEPESSQSSPSIEDVMLTKTNLRTGITYPAKSKLHASDDEKSRKKKKMNRSDLNAGDIHDLLFEEKCTSAEEQLAMFGASSSKVLTSEKIDDNWTVDDVITSKLEKKKRKKEDEELKSTVKAHKIREQTLDSCTVCIDSKHLRRHLVVAVGLKTYLSVPTTQPLVEHQCLIVPSAHVSSCVQMDEDVYDEMRIWRKGLVAMFRADDQDVIFIETAKNVMHQPHTFVECFPVPLSIGEVAPLYFKKAILECEKEWAQNKKIINLREKDLRRSIPSGFAYISVDFGLQPGYAHVIEDEKLIPASFGKEIIAGMMDLDSNLWRRPVKQNFDQQLKRTEMLREKWKPFDWTEGVKERIRNQDTDSDNEK